MKQSASYYGSFTDLCTVKLSSLVIPWPPRTSTYLLAQGDICLPCGVGPALCICYILASQYGWRRIRSERKRCGTESDLRVLAEIVEARELLRAGERCAPVYFIEQQPACPDVSPPGAELPLISVDNDKNT